MSRRVQYPAGVPCFVEALTPDLDAALRFYRGVFGWTFAGPGAMPGDPPGDYFVARVDGDDVAGIGSAPAGQGAAGGWPTPPPDGGRRPAAPPTPQSTGPTPPPAARWRRGARW